LSCTDRVDAVFEFSNPLRSLATGSGVPGFVRVAWPLELVAVEPGHSVLKLDDGGGQQASSPVTMPALLAHRLLEVARLRLPVVAVARAVRLAVVTHDKSVALARSVAGIGRTFRADVRARPRNGETTVCGAS
jgi:hypothetical protein